ncbi:hypothetical protein [Ralstonia flatus]|uniref:hypothetical protein n=1 Tax=Ralstonia flatus TaxID=3058601 RepID=UPI00292E3BA0|nr:hypothetical protein [Ralstonia sp. LMG 32965]
MNSRTRLAHVRHRRARRRASCAMRVEKNDAWMRQRTRIFRTRHVDTRAIGAIDACISTCGGCRSTLLTHRAHLRSASRDVDAIAKTDFMRAAPANRVPRIRCEVAAMGRSIDACMSATSIRVHGWMLMHATLTSDRDDAELHARTTSTARPARRSTERRSRENPAQQLLKTSRNRV